MNLENFIDIIYKKTKFRKKDIELFAKKREKIYNAIRNYFRKSLYNIPKIELQGSYATKTSVIIPTDTSDIDISVIMDENISAKKVAGIRHNLKQFLESKLNNTKVKVKNKLGKCSIKVKIKHKPYDICIDIVFYRMFHGRQQLYYKHNWVDDDKSKNTKYLKKRISENKDLRKIVFCFKYIYRTLKHGRFANAVLPSIAIFEIVVQNYIEDKNICFSLAKTLYNILINLHNKFEIRTSDDNRENLLENNKRHLNRFKKPILGFLSRLYNEILYAYQKNAFRKNKTDLLKAVIQELKTIRKRI